jgi:DNA end-binding protein Ku
MRPIWKGSISFGLVNIPVRLFPATDEETLDIQMLDDRDHTRVRYKRVSEATGKKVPFEHIVKCFELENGEYVVLSDEEIQNASPQKSAKIDILEFVDEAQISSLYFDRPYYLEPEKSAAKAYALFRDALAQSGKVGIAQFVLRNREHLCALKAQDGVLVLNTLRFADGIRPTADLAIPHGQKIGEKEVSMAARLIEEMSGNFKPEKYKNSFTEDLKKLIEARRRGRRSNVRPRRLLQPKSWTSCLSCKRVLISSPAASRN